MEPLSQIKQRKANPLTLNLVGLTFDDYDNGQRIPETVELLFTQFLGRRTYSNTEGDIS